MSGRLEAVDRMARGRIARAMSLAVGRIVAGDPVCGGTPNRHLVAASRRCHRRLSGLLLLPPAAGTQGTGPSGTVAGVVVAGTVAARPNPDGRGRHADQA